MSKIDEIRTRLEAATPGPWVVGHNGRVETTPEVVDFHRFDIMSETVARVELRDEDAEFIANAPEDIAFLLDLVRKLSLDSDQHADRSAA